MRDGLREQRLAGARRAVEEDALRHLRAESLEPLRLAHELDDLHELAAHLLDAGDIRPGRRRVFAPVIMFAGLTRGIIPAVRQRSQAVQRDDDEEREREPGRGEVRAAWNQWLTIYGLIGSEGRIPSRVTQPASAAVVKRTPASRQAAVQAATRPVDAARRVLDERDPAAAPEERAHRSVVADVGGDAEEEDLVRIERCRAWSPCSGS